MGYKHIKWDEEKNRELKQLIDQKTSWKDISVKMRLSQNSVQRQARILGLSKAPAHVKYSVSFAQKVARYYLTHTHTQTADHFKLSFGQLRGMLENNKSVLNLSRKDSRNYKPYSSQEILQCLVYAGLKPTFWISHKVRGSASKTPANHLYIRLNIKPQRVHGIPYKWASEIFGEKIRGQMLTSGRGRSTPILVLPWVRCVSLYKGDNPVIKECFNAMAEFQKAILGCDSEREVMQKIQKILDEK